MVQKYFSGAVRGEIPNAGDGMGRIMGKPVGDIHALAARIGDGVRDGVMTPVNMLVSLKPSDIAVTQVVPGGRKLEDLAKSQVEGKVPFKPQDLFGAGPSNN